VCGEVNAERAELAALGELTALGRVLFIRIFVETSVHFSCIARARAHEQTEYPRDSNLNKLTDPLYTSSLKEDEEGRGRELLEDRAINRFPIRESLVSASLASLLRGIRNEADKSEERGFSRRNKKTIANFFTAVSPRGSAMDSHASHRFDNGVATTPDREREREREKESGKESALFTTRVRHVGRRICIADEEVSSCGLNERGISLETRPPSSRRPRDKARSFHRPVKIVAEAHRRLKQRAAVPR